MDVEECWKVIGKQPISTKWVDLRKGADVRSRWVARDFKPKLERDREDLFASMPPLEAKKLLFQKSREIRKDGKKMKLLFIDVRKAHLNGICDEDVFVELPPEAKAPGKCGKLLKWLYGTRPAAQAWEKDYSDKLQKEGFEKGKASSTVFVNKSKEIYLVVHGDDFTFLGEERDLKDITEKMKS